MQYMPSGLLPTVVVSWCAGAYHLSKALQGVSGHSSMLVDTLWAFPSHVDFSSDRFMISLFACAEIDSKILIKKEL